MIPTRRAHAKLRDRKELAVLVMEEDSVPAIARRIGCSKSSVKSALLFHGLAQQETVRKKV